MVQNTYQPWIYEEDITTSHWMSHQYPKQPSLHHLENMNTLNYPLDSHKCLRIFRNSWCILKDFPFTIAYLDDIIIFSRTAEEHLDHIRLVFKKLQNEHSLINETHQMPLLCQRDPVPWTNPQHHRHQMTITVNSNHQQHASAQNS